jgi:SAM-dependent methyltransferase
MAGRWLSGRDIAESYDRVAPTYNEAWQRRLRPVTDRLLERLPTGLSGNILDLGCGTGYATRQLARLNPAAKICGVDISPGMLVEAQADAPGNTRYVASDMLEFARSSPSGSTQMVVSTWALGYSHPSRLFGAYYRALESGGIFGFVVNYFDTLAPVFRAYRLCMFEFPERVQRAAWPRFPHDWRRLKGQLEGNDLLVEWHEDGEESIAVPEGRLLPWLKQTGILAGFDAMLDLSGPVGEYFETELQRDRSRFVHHYAAVIARKE